MTVRLKSDYGSDRDSYGDCGDSAIDDLFGDETELSEGEQNERMDAALRTQFTSADTGGFGTDRSGGLPVAARKVQSLLQKYPWFRSAKPGVCRGRPCVLVTVTRYSEPIEECIPRTVRPASRGQTAFPIEVIPVGRLQTKHAQTHAARTSRGARVDTAFARNQVLLHTQQVFKFLKSQWCPRGQCPAWLQSLTIGLDNTAPAWLQRLSIGLGNTAKGPAPCIKVMVKSGYATKQLLAQIPTTIEAVPICVLTARTTRSSRGEFGADNDNTATILGPTAPATTPVVNQTGYSDEAVAFAQQIWDEYMQNPTGSTNATPPQATPAPTSTAQANSPPPSLFVQGPVVQLQPLPSNMNGEEYSSYGYPIDGSETLGNYGAAFRHWRSRGGEFGDELAAELETGLSSVGYTPPVQVGVVMATTTFYTFALSLLGVKGWWLLLGLPLGILSGMAGLMGAVAMRAAAGDPKAIALMNTVKGNPALPSKG